MPKTVFFEQFMTGESAEDPVIHAAQPLLAWEESLAGKWCLKHSKTTPVWYISEDMSRFGYVLRVVGDLSDEDTLIFRLKFC